MGLGLDTLGAGTLRRLATGVVTFASYLADFLRATAFWGTIVLPLVIVAGLLTTSAPAQLALLVGLNVLCILIGRSHRPGD